MFTGIVQAVGKIVRVSPLEVQCPALGLSDVAVGASIAVQGSPIAPAGALALYRI